MELLPPDDMTGKSPSVLEDGVAQDPKWQREVNAETGGCAPVTKKSKNLLRCDRLEDKKRQLILKNQELREKVTELRALIVKANEEIPIRLEAHEAEQSRWEEKNKKLDDDITMARLLNSGESP